MEKEIARLKKRLKIVEPGTPAYIQIQKKLSRLVQQKSEKEEPEGQTVEEIKKEEEDKLIENIRKSMKSRKQNSAKKLSKLIKR